MRAKMLHTIEMLRVNGNQLREPYSKSLSNGIFELRVKVGSDISRVLYFFVIGQKNYFNEWFC
jgi:phage-related protein